MCSLAWVPGMAHSPGAALHAGAACQNAPACKDGAGQHLAAQGLAAALPHVLQLGQPATPVSFTNKGQQAHRPRREVRS